VLGTACYRRRVKIAVVIPALDEADRIAGAIESATRTRAAAAAEFGEVGRVGQVGAGSEERVEIGFERGVEEAGVQVEVWVVDGGSRDDTRERASRLGARVLCAPPGRARQLQAGVEASDGEVVLFLHADTRLPTGWADAVRGALADPRASGGAFGFSFDEGRGWALRLVEWGARLRVRLLGLPYGDQALFVRRSLLERIGGVPQAPLMEDLDLVRAMKREGRVVRLPLAARTSARRYLAGGVLRTMLRNWLALAAWRLGVDRRRVAAWVSR
jgi:rSAM/selenodomain-associated transferase 2